MSSSNDNVLSPIYFSNSDRNCNVTNYDYVNTTNIDMSQTNLDLCSKCCAATFPFASVVDFEFLLLCGNTSNCNSVYNGTVYFSPTQLSNLTHEKSKNDLL